MIHFGVIQQNWSFDKFNILFILVSFDDEKWVYILLYCKKIKIVLSIFFYSLWLDILNLWHISRSKAEKLFTWMLMSTKFCFFRNVLIFDLRRPTNKKMKNLTSLFILISAANFMIDGRVTLVIRMLGQLFQPIMKRPMMERK